MPRGAIVVVVISQGGAVLDVMTQLPPSGLSLAGFALAHAVWSLSDTEDEELLCPLAVVETHAGERKLTRFAAETQEAAIIAGKAAMREASAEAAAWAFAREAVWRKMGIEQTGDVLAVDFWATGMPGAATIMQHFNRATNGSRFRISASPTLVFDGIRLSADVAAPSITAIMAGVHSHTAVAALWPTWC
jgi:phosphopantetheinyl transferase (holo-ACP synthase)